ncbi:hypothetical protein [Winogradskyella psychrotolerans]|uniref:hypothetical protein n=1 Tax=Winogradskyella psychrotolerans TaxID=1344585 RepID=UPI001C07EAFA|nr:hypothetical protein [Winogradskyella psychrotolerans]MBU2927789.1 hypothetical protein [Winogradskyella psychrotolerans]
MPFKHTYLFLLGLILLSSFAVVQDSETTQPIQLITTQTDYNVGDSVVLKFSTSEGEHPLLYCSNSYGSTLVTAELNANTLQYKIPENITKKIGAVSWKLLDKTTSLSGTFTMNPKAEVATMETYIGPPSIEAGGTDYTMLVVIPTDSLDNPVPTNTLVNAKHQFLASEETTDIFTKNLIAYKNIYSKQESGRMLVSSESLGINSKEFTINVSAAIPTDFTISATRPHAYADGNQITTFSTSIIKDKQNNVVSDGTYVTFFITNQKQNILKTTGTTIDGIAQAKIIHPDYKDAWTVKAYVDGMAESESIALQYKSVIEDYNVKFSKQNRSITVGPLQSFMGQMIPDGLHVKLHIYKANKHIETLTKTSFNGYANFNLKPAIYSNGNYNFSIETAGITKQFNTKKLW